MVSENVVPVLHKEQVDYEVKKVDRRHQNAEIQSWEMLDINKNAVLAVRCWAGRYGGQSCPDHMFSS